MSLLPPSSGRVSATGSASAGVEWAGPATRGHSAGVAVGWLAARRRGCGFADARIAPAEQVLSVFHRGSLPGLSIGSGSLTIRASAGEAVLRSGIGSIRMPRVDKSSPRGYGTEKRGANRLNRGVKRCRRAPTSDHRKRRFAARRREGAVEIREVNRHRARGSAARRLARTCSSRAALGIAATFGWRSTQASASSAADTPRRQRSGQGVHGRRDGPSRAASTPSPRHRAARTTAAGRTRSRASRGCRAWFTATRCHRGRDQLSRSATSSSTHPTTRSARRPPVLEGGHGLDRGTGPRQW